MIRVKIKPQFLVTCDNCDFQEEFVGDEEWAFRFASEHNKKVHNEKEKVIRFKSGHM